MGPQLPKCVGEKAAGFFEDNCLKFKPWGLVVMVTRCLNENGTLTFSYFNGEEFLLYRQNDNSTNFEEHYEKLNLLKRY